jgi:outer membrane protein assembly factor BamD (BamD/ComL family)
MKGDMPLDRRVFSQSYKRVAALLTAGCAALWLSACSTNDMTAAVYVERPIEQIYNAAWFQINRENWLEAGRQFAPQAS